VDDAPSLGVRARWHSGGQTDAVRKASRRSGVAFVATEHEEKLTGPLACVRRNLAAYEAGEIDAFEVDAIKVYPRTLEMSKRRNIGAVGQTIAFNGAKGIEKPFGPTAVIRVPSSALSNM